MYKYKEKDDRYHEEKMKFIARIFPKNKGKVLDIGCYKGELGLNLKDYDYYGLDVDKELLEEVKKKGLKAFYCDLDKDEILFKEKFNYIVALDVLEHLHNPGKVLEKIKKSLKKDGLLLISLPNDFHFLNRIRFLLGKAIYPDPFWEHTHLHTFTRRQAKEFLEEKGFKILKKYELPGTFPMFFSFDLRRKIAKLMPNLFGRGTLFVLRR